MSLFVLGLNHRTASLSLRERLAFGPENLVAALTTLSQLAGVQEVCLLSTCNRTEIYADLESATQATLRQWWAQFCRVPLDELDASLYQHQEGEAVRHLMRVASGLDSLVLGEPQILGQLKSAVDQARQQGAVKSLLGRLFERSFSVAKRVRTETEIGANGVSVAFVAVSLARQIFANAGSEG